MPRVCGRVPGAGGQGGAALPREAHAAAAGGLLLRVLWLVTPKSNDKRIFK